MVNDAEHLFMCLFTIHIPLVKYLFMSSAHFLIEFFSLLDFESSLCILDLSSSLLNLWFANILSQSIAYLFILLLASSIEQKFIILMSIIYQLFLFMDHIFV